MDVNVEIRGITYKKDSRYKRENAEYVTEVISVDVNHYGTANVCIKKIGGWEKVLSRKEFSIREKNELKMLSDIFMIAYNLCDSKKSTK